MHMANNDFDEISIEPVVLPEDHPLSLREEDLPKIFEQYDKLIEEMIKRHKEGKEFKFYHFNIDLQGGPCVYKRISGCGAGHEYVAISPSGDVYPCHQFVGNEDFKMGNIMKDFEVKEDTAKEFKKLIYTINRNVKNVGQDFTVAEDAKQTIIILIKI